MCNWHQLQHMQRTGKTRTFSFMMALVNPRLFHQKSSLWDKLLVRMENYLKGKCFHGNRMLNWEATLNSLKFKNYFHKLLIWQAQVIFFLYFYAVNPILVLPTQVLSNYPIMIVLYSPAWWFLPNHRLCKFSFIILAIHMVQI